MNSDRFADSAGVPWDGRSFEPNPFANDNGAADPALIAAIKDFHEEKISAAAVVHAFSEARLLIPLLANLGSSGVGAHGKVVDKSADLSIVTVLDPDGRMAVPVFSSVESMGRWNKTARPVPSDAIRVCLSAVQEDGANARVILDPGSDTEFALRRPAVWAVAQQRQWIPAYEDPEVIEDFAQALAEEPMVRTFRLLSADPTYRLQGQEVAVVIWLEPGLTAEQLADFESRFVQTWSEKLNIVERIDSLTIIYKNATDLDEPAP